MIKKNVSLACVTDVGFISVLCCALDLNSTKFHIFEVLFVLRLAGMKFETDNTSRGVEKVTNGSYDVCKITVNNLQIENEIS